MREHTAPGAVPNGTVLRNERRSARRQSRAKGEMPARDKLRRRCRRSIASDARGRLNIQNGRGAEIRSLDIGHGQDEVILLKEVFASRHDTARFIATRLAGRRMVTVLRATIALLDETSGFHQTKRAGWQPCQHQQSRCQCLEQPHNEQTTTEKGAVQPNRLINPSRVAAGLCTTARRLGEGTAFPIQDLSKRSAFAITTSVAPVSARIASQRLVWPDKANKRKIAFTDNAKAMFP